MSKDWPRLVGFQHFFNVLEKCFFFKPHALVLHLNEGKHGVYKPKDKEKRDLV